MEKGKSWLRCGRPRRMPTNYDRLVAGQFEEDFSLDHNQQKTAMEVAMVLNRDGEWLDAVKARPTQPPE